jgi:vacuolar-type H+-ATPase subunit D/Vma8
MLLSFMMFVEADRFQKFLKSLIEIATLQTKFEILDEIIQVTNRSVNALEFVVSPNLLHRQLYR